MLLNNSLTFPELLTLLATTLPPAILLILTGIILLSLMTSLYIYLLINRNLRVFIEICCLTSWQAKHLIEQISLLVMVTVDMATQILKNPTGFLCFHANWSRNVAHWLEIRIFSPAII